MKQLYCIPIGPQNYDCFTQEQFQAKCQADQSFEERDAPRAVLFQEVSHAREELAQNEVKTLQEKLNRAMRTMGFSMAGNRPVTAQEIQEVESGR